MSMSGAMRTILLLAAAGLAMPAAAQTNDYVFQEVPWNFSTPGARANGMGRTFIGQADDASAAVTNPAGLMNLTKPQIYAEFKNFNVSVDRLANADAYLTLQPTTFSTNLNALPFLSFSMPLPVLNNKLAVGFSISQFLNYQEQFSLQPRTLVDQAAGNYINFAAFPVDVDVDLRAQSFGGSVAYAIRNDLMVGVTISANRLVAKSTGTRFNFQFGPTYTAARPNTDLIPTNVPVNQTSIDDSSVKPGATFGVIYKPSEMVQAGLSYTKSPKFTVGERFLRNANGSFVPFSPPFGSFPDPALLPIYVPDRFGAGVAVHPTSRLLVAADVVWINYSSLADNFLVTLDFATPSITPNLFTVDDATEFHFGGEYNLMTGTYPVFVRAGLFTNPDHKTRYSGTTAADPGTNAYYDSMFNLLPRDTLVRGTFGAGIVIGPRVQIDAAYVHKKEFVASTAVRF